MKRKVYTVLAGILCCLSIVGTFIEKYCEIASYAWICSIVLLCIIWIPIKKRQIKIKSSIPLIGIVIIATLLRTIHLVDIPAFVHGDEAWIGLEAREILQELPKISIVQPGWYDYPKLTFLIPAISMGIIGDSLFSLRIASVFLGIFSIICVYLFMNRLFGKYEAIVAAVLLTVSHLHIHFSRTGTQYMQGLVFFEVAIMLFLLAMKEKRQALYLFSGLITGLGFHSYLSARGAPLVIVLSLAIGWIFKRKSDITWNDIKMFLLGIFFGIGPLWTKSTDLIAKNSRTSEVFIFSNGTHLMAETGGNWGQVIAQQFVSTTSFLFGGADQSIQYGINRPGIDIFTYGFFIIGTLLLWKHSKKTQHEDGNLSSWLFIFLMTWIAVILCFGGFLTIDTPFYPRLLPSVIPICMLAAYGIVRCCTKCLRAQQWLIYGLAIGCISYINLTWYFITYQQPDVDRDTYTAIGKFISPISNKHYLFVGQENETFDYATIQFLAPKAKGNTVQSPFDAIAELHKDASSELIMTTEAPVNGYMFLLPKNRYFWRTMKDHAGNILFYYLDSPFGKR